MYSAETCQGTVDEGPQGTTNPHSEKMIAIESHKASSTTSEEQRNDLEHKLKKARKSFVAAEQLRDEMKNSLQMAKDHLPKIAASQQNQLRLEKRVEYLKDQAKKWSRRCENEQEKMQTDKLEHHEAKQVQPDNMVQALQVTHFQLAIDDLLENIREKNLEHIRSTDIEYSMKRVIYTARCILTDVDASSLFDVELNTCKMHLKKDVTETAHVFIATCQSFVSNFFFSPAADDSDDCWFMSHSLCEATSHFSANIIALIHVINAKKLCNRCLPQNEWFSKSDNYFFEPDHDLFAKPQEPSLDSRAPVVPSLPAMMRALSPVSSVASSSSYSSSVHSSSMYSS